MSTALESSAGASSQHPDHRLDTDLWYQALRHVVRQPPDTAQAAIVGAAAGLLYGAGQLTAAELVGIVRGYLRGTSSDPQQSCAIIRGLLATAREVAWHVEEILVALDEQFGNWDESAFLSALPDLRLAFSELSLQEITRIADAVARLHGATDLGSLVQPDLHEGDVRAALQLSIAVADTLVSDGIKISRATAKP